MKETLSLDSVVKISDDVVFRDLHGEAVLLDLKTSLYFGVDSIGARTWNLIKEHNSLQTVCDLLMKEYHVDEAQCTQDLLKFVSMLEEKRLIKV